MKSGDDRDTDMKVLPFSRNPPKLTPMELDYLEVVTMSRNISSGNFTNECELTVIPDTGYTIYMNKSIANGVEYITTEDMEGNPPQEYVEVMAHVDKVRKVFKLTREINHSVGFVGKKAGLDLLGFFLDGGDILSHLYSYDGSQFAFISRDKIRKYLPPGAFIKTIEGIRYCKVDNRVFNVDSRILLPLRLDDISMYSSTSNMAPLIEMMNTLHNVNEKFWTEDRNRKSRPNLRVVEDT